MSSGIEGIIMNTAETKQNPLAPTTHTFEVFAKVTCLRLVEKFSIDNQSVKIELRQHPAE
ncbi:MAG TPA: hypothetical protein VJZ32_12275 [Candidatus Bathyarchaeia archaeon]|nr:hypothetical protein [Candidatus Bathyarchaeia archaeon]